jgi:hypothetical protein
MLNAGTKLKRSCRPELTLLSPPQKAIRNDLDMVLVVDAIPGPKASDGRSHREFVGGTSPIPGVNTTLWPTVNLWLMPPWAKLAKLEIDG